MEIIPLTSDDSRVYSSIPKRYAPDVSLARNIHVLRRAADLTQKALAKTLGVSQGAVSKWETGTAEPSASDLPKIAVVLGATLDQLLRGVSARYDARHGGSRSVDVMDATTPRLSDDEQEWRALFDDVEEEGQRRLLLNIGRQFSRKALSSPGSTLAGRARDADTRARAQKSRAAKPA